MLENLNSIFTRIQAIQNKMKTFSQFGANAKPSKFGEMLEKNIQEQSKSIDDIITEKAKKFGLDNKLLKSIVKVESNYKPNAVSSKGAKGLMQLMPGTAKHLGVKDVFSPEENIEGGAKYLKNLMKKYDNNLDLALAAYNSGPNAVDAVGGVPNFPETQNYVQKVMELYKKKQGIE